MTAPDFPPLTKSQKQYLKRRHCGLCEVSLHRRQCASIWEPMCTKEQMIDRETRCLAKYKPRTVGKP